MLKGTIPVADESYDLSDPVGSVKTVGAVGVGFAMLFAGAAIGRAVWNRASQTTDRVEEIELV